MYFQLIILAEWEGYRPLLTVDLHWKPKVVGSMLPDYERDILAP